MNFQGKSQNGNRYPMLSVSSEGSGKNQGSILQDLPPCSHHIQLRNDASDTAPAAGAVWGGAVAGTISTAPVNAPKSAPNKERQAQTNRTISAPNHSQWSPSVQNLLDKPAATFPRRLIWGGIGFCAVFLTWAWFGQINEVGHAQGELVPQGEVIKVHPVQMGKVAKIAVKEGDTVKKGQVLMELETDISAAEVERLQQQLAGYEMEIVQTKGLLDRLVLEAETRLVIADADIRAHQASIEQARQNIATTKDMLLQQESDTAALELRRQKLQPLLAKTQTLLQQQQTDVEASLARSQGLAPLRENTQDLLQQLQTDLAAKQERVERLKPLVEQGAISQDYLFQAEQAVRESENAIIRTKLADETQTGEKLFEAEQTWRDRQSAMIRTQLSEETMAKERLFEVEQALRDREERITETRGRVEQAAGELERLQAQLAQKQAEAASSQIEAQQRIDQMQLEVTRLASQKAQTQTQITRAKAELKQRFLYIPVDGVVLSLDITHSGEVVQPGKTVAEIAPAGAPLVLAAKIPNREAGLLKTGSKVQLKFDAYPYQEYGIFSGSLTSISPDARVDDRLGSVYNVEIALDRDYVSDKGENIHFKAGQTASADIIIRQRRIVDLMLDPIRQIREGGLNL
ncbi:MAG TPA: HlyD family efflux transporter periplasmic adaptor subunit [Oscillatoriaceae cyanobacterium M33_DOE_052]|uniref:HlyD family efflux transporter periplasmic adaptor subunit n=1 Tax=Planktothricoides sp. SpSt-374 TaxID=2282167 RepID=A0A7C3ZTH0_9CYAN|nr:HlyD family efflux transporter periplasmic adaptor subunit [Oscillatoriaceae cyanobacterium M33_DOE_052]